MTIVAAPESALEALAAQAAESYATVAIRDLIAARDKEKRRLEKIHLYVRGKQPQVAIPEVGSPEGIMRIARIARVNICKIVVSALTQVLYVDGFRDRDSSDEAPAWAIWQANGMDKRQIGVHRAAVTYGLSYVTVLPGLLDAAPMPAIRGYSPRHLTALYDAPDDDWPVVALCVDVLGPAEFRYRMLDDQSVWYFRSGEKDGDVEFMRREEHGIGVCPVIRFDNEVELDDDRDGEVEHLMVLQDQADLTTFELLVAQHYGAYRQRYIKGWAAKDQLELAKMGASRIMTFDEDPDKIDVGEFDQTDLKGYLESREATLRHAATLSQTPVHELIGQLANLSADALVAAEAGHRRKVTERQRSFGESWERVLRLAGSLLGEEASPSAQVRWADTESRAFAATVDGLTKLTAIGIPVESILDRVPGFTQQDVEAIKSAIAKRRTDDLAVAQAALAARAPSQQQPPAGTAAA